MWKNDRQILNFILTQLVLFRRSEKSILVKWTHVFAFLSEFSRFFQDSKNQKPQTYCKSTFWSIASITQIILARKIAFLFVLSYFGGPKNAKNVILRASMICVMIVIPQKVDLQYV